MIQLIAMAPTQQTAEGAQAQPAWVGMGYMLIIVILMYFVLIRPQSQRQKQQQALIQSAKTGDKIIAAGGIHGVITNVKDTSVVMKIDEGVKIEIEKSSIISIVKE